MHPIYVEIEILATKHFLEDKIIESVSCTTFKDSVDVPEPSQSFGSTPHEKLPSTVIPSLVITMNEDGDIRKCVIKLVDITEIHHRFSTFIQRRMKGCCWVIRDEWDYFQVRYFEPGSPRIILSEGGSNNKVDAW
jgi:hypothetical protein